MHTLGQMPARVPEEGLEHLQKLSKAEKGQRQKWRIRRQGRNPHTPTCSLAGAERCLSGGKKVGVQSGKVEG